jgi:hypothetical protein
VYNLYIIIQNNKKAILRLLLTILSIGCVKTSSLHG